jgi:hypothetical protein
LLGAAEGGVAKKVMLRAGAIAGNLDAAAGFGANNPGPRISVVPRRDMPQTAAVFGAAKTSAVPLKATARPPATAIAVSKVVDKFF